MQTNYASTTTYFVGNYYEVTNGVVTKYYYAGSQRIAMRKNGVLNFIIGDHLGSTSLVTDASGTVVSQQQYKAWGETRYSSGSEATKYQYTGQFSYESDFGLQFYNARWYDSSLGRFTSADSIVPDGVQGYDRYAYVNNSPMNYVDPSGYDPSLNNCDYAGLCDANGNSLPIQTTVPVQMIFSGAGIDASGNVDITQPNTVQAQIPLYQTNQDGFLIPSSNFINYPGYTYDEAGNLINYGKTKQAESARGKLANASVILICYSAGTEACLMYARWRIDNGQKVSSVVLLGPSFKAPNENNQVINYDGWANYMDYLLQNKVDVLVVSDGPDSRQAQGFTPSPVQAGQQQGTFTYTEQWWGQPHFAYYGTGTNNNPEIKKYVYDWIAANR